MDLIARRGSVTVFAEVKTRRSRSFGHPLEAITYRKRREVTAAAREWLRERGSGEPGIRRFDAIAVFILRDGTVDVEHVEGAWRAGE